MSPILPFLKWAGGKRQLLTELRRFYPRKIGRYFEPFVGSGAVFFDLASLGQIDGVPAVLSDANADLIGTYLRVRDDTDALIDALDRLAKGHARDSRAHYYKIRDERFNPDRDRWRTTGGDPNEYPVGLAAMLLYLNRTGYNGLFRLNAAGHFNVPAGRYENPRLVNAARLRRVAEVLRSPSVEVRHLPFDRAVASARADDLVYFDPPYAPVSATAHFRSYTAAGFSGCDQTRLRDLAIALANTGAAVVLSNSTAPSILSLYEARAAKQAGLRCFRIPARRAINSRADRRGEIDELVVSNVVPAARHQQRSKNEESRPAPRDAGTAGCGRLRSVPSETVRGKGRF
jgi:DNA adenine methylase